MHKQKNFRRRHNRAKVMPQTEHDEVIGNKHTKL